VPDSEKLLESDNQIQKIFTFKNLKSKENQKLMELKELLLSKLATVEYYET